MEEFRQYPHYMQPRIHKMMQEVRAAGPAGSHPCIPVPRASHQSPLVRMIGPREPRMLRQWQGEVWRRIFYMHNGVCLFVEER